MVDKWAKIVREHGPISRVVIQVLNCARGGVLATLLATPPSANGDAGDELATFGDGDTFGDTSVGSAGCRRHDLDSATNGSCDGARYLAG